MGGLLPSASHWAHIFRTFSALFVDGLLPSASHWAHLFLTFSALFFDAFCSSVSIEQWSFRFAIYCVAGVGYQDFRTA